MSLNEKRRELAGVLLDLAADHYGNHGCNDFRLDEVMPDVEDRRAVMKEYHEHNGDPEEFNPRGDYEYAPDFVLMHLCARWAREPERIDEELRRLRKLEACSVPHGFDEDPASGPDDGGWRCSKCGQGKSAAAHSNFPGK